MGLILWIVFGALVGWLASIIMSTDAQMGALANIGVGIVGAILGGWIMSLLGYPGVSGFNLYGLLVAILGSIVLIWIVRMARSGAVGH
ncbi:MAG: hypothetical protein A3J07_00260 [Candidatus Doudnabacteria bacterium RIFCSPLOWO2_02_FULL_49_13]|uniref:Transglycosylase n=1 Tax=Candidatus Doudnabacteria bacterium RIFCSPHIGHO2_12_FULL_48_16 TaxID=1817838 RepID=A0A1F5PJE6_9BACT|nr:MAG: hypothetical protein A3B77_00150 [Candidatus Doudnabacteria bacterium RIFCSPHIGHO2_02_FULL_49_24]OGE89541.1 MAG: hypothetical protein A2760_03410 [Candidatus Doudnabacteria bacterium RIFCSPHIGHO2_01_FULL_50_67]OGE89792.1 MAG: hypothetical protein A3E29_00180 [Candidatus Doudnabacteria bacterium RIFCSPHIGHO2_12_FULL_48_16]OGE97696.1 MAG: hypothetical protein A2990_00660 [Candidatus Doudnabacteria bacterium RIFCSPLOWO2_01_FULL_49_40]OGF02795.1 MAG: hypothetical protein A3J07_00260 [Candid